MASVQTVPGCSAADVQLVSKVGSPQKDRRRSVGANAGDSPFQHPPSSLIDDGLSHEIVESRSHRRRCSLWWRKSLLEALGEHTVVELFFIGLAVIAGTGAVFFLFVI